MHKKTVACLRNLCHHELNWLFRRNGKPDSSVIFICLSLIINCSAKGIAPELINVISTDLHSKTLILETTSEQNLEDLTFFYTPIGLAQPRDVTAGLVAKTKINSSTLAYIPSAAVEAAPVAKIKFHELKIQCFLKPRHHRFTPWSMRTNSPVTGLKASSGVIESFFIM